MITNANNGEALLSLIETYLEGMCKKHNATDVQISLDMSIGKVTVKFNSKKSTASRWRYFLKPHRVGNIGRKYLVWCLNEKTPQPQDDLPG